MGENKELHVTFIPDDRLAMSEYATAANIDGRWIFFGHREPYRFLVLEDGTIIIGPVSNHVTLWLLHTNQEKLLVRPQLIGAGVIDERGKISSWESRLFGKETPEALRGSIEDFIKGLVAGGSLPLPPKE